MISRRPATTDSGAPPATALPNVERSGVTPKWACAPPSAIRKPVITSSMMKSVPCRRQRSRTPSR